MQELVKEQRYAGRRAEDIKRELLESSMKELPNFLVTVLDDERGLYSFYYGHREEADDMVDALVSCLLYTSPSPRDQRGSRMPSSA